jgi:hypothetical protein
MKALILSIMLVCVAQSRAQEQFNQLTSHQQKTGKWIYFYPNGLIDKICFYEPVSRKLSAQEAFNMDLPSRNSNSQIQHYEELLWTEFYEYTDNWQFYRTRIRNTGTYTYTFCYNIDRDFELINKIPVLVHRINSKALLFLELENNLSKPIVLNFSTQSENIRFQEKQFVLGAGQSTKIYFEVEVEPNDRDYQIDISTDNTKTSIVLNARGFHFSSLDVVDNGVLNLQRNMIFYRHGNETLLRIFDKRKRKLIKEISLAQLFVELDLSELKNGRYHLCFVDFASNKQYWMTGELKE